MTPIRGLVVMVVVWLLGCAEYRLEPTQDGSVGSDDGGVSGAGGGSGGGAGGAGGGQMTGGGGGGGTIDPGFTVCSDVGRPLALTPLDLFILLDVSFSMDYDFKFAAVRSAIKSFSTNEEFAGLGVGVQYFPLRTQCRIDAYQVPAVPIDRLPGNAVSIARSLDEQRMQGGTPMVPALSGAVAYTKAYLNQFPADAGRKAVIVLATDGVPDNSCAGDQGQGLLPNTIGNVEEVARGSLMSSPSVQTFVVGVGRQLGVLDGIARAGGTDRAVLVDVAANADVQFLSALTQIRKDALGCDFEVPPPVVLQADGGRSVVDGTRASVVFEPTEGAPVLFPLVADVAACGTGPGWFFSSGSSPVADGGSGVGDGGVGDGGVDDGGVGDGGVDGGADAGVAGAGRKVLLCPASCDLITSGRTGQLKVQFACGID